MYFFFIQYYYLVSLQVLCRYRSTYFLNIFNPELSASQSNNLHQQKPNTSSSCQQKVGVFYYETVLCLFRTQWTSFLVFYFKVNCTKWLSLLSLHKTCQFQSKILILTFMLLLLSKFWRYQKIYFQTFFSRPWARSYNSDERYKPGLVSQAK